MRTKKKRKLIIDEVISISAEEMKNQLSDTSDIVAIFDSAPPTKKLMNWKETAGVEKLFGIPGHQIPSKTLSKVYLKHLTTRSVENEEFCEEIGKAQFGQSENGTSTKQESVSKEVLSIYSYQLVNSRPPANVSNYLKSFSPVPSVELITHGLSHNAADTSQ